MSGKTPTRQEALGLVLHYNETDSLVNHAKAVEAAMRYMARKTGADEEMWGAIGLVHDLDYEKFPAQHCHKTEAILRENDWPEDYIRAVLSHGWGICTDIEPQSLVEKTLYTVDDLAGVDREVVARGMAMLGVEFDEITTDVIAALREVSDEIGL